MQILPPIASSTGYSSSLALPFQQNLSSPIKPENPLYSISQNSLLLETCIWPGSMGLKYILGRFLWTMFLPEIWERKLWVKSSCPPCFGYWRGTVCCWLLLQPANYQKGLKGSQWADLGLMYNWADATTLRPLLSHTLLRKSVILFLGIDMSLLNLSCPSPYPTLLYTI